MKTSPRNIRKPIARGIVAVIALSLVAGCISKMDPADVEALKSKNIELENAVKMLTTQVRTLNDEHVEMKRIVSDMTDSVLKQTGTLERLESSMKQLAERPAPAPAPVRAAAPEVRRPAAPSRSTATKAPAKPAPRSAPARTQSRPGVKKPAGRRE